MLCRVVVHPLVLCCALCYVILCIALHVLCCVVSPVVMPVLLCVVCCVGRVLSVVLCGASLCVAL